VLTGEDIDQVTAFYPDRHEVELDDPIISPLFGKLEVLQMDNDNQAYGQVCVERV